MHPDQALREYIADRIDSDDDEYDLPILSLDSTHADETLPLVQKEGNNENEKDEDFIESEEIEEIEEELPLAPYFPDEVWLPIAAYLDLGGWNTFIRVCQPFFNIGNDSEVIGRIFINEVRRRVSEGNYSLALVRCWQGILSILRNYELITPESVHELRPLLTDTGHTREMIPQALCLFNQEAINFEAFEEQPRTLIQRLWTQGTLLFRAENEPNRMFIRELVGVFNTMDREAMIHITVQRLFAVLDEFHHPIQAHVAALNALTMLFTEEMLSDKDMQTTLTVMLHIITGKEHPEITRLSSAGCIQRLLPGNVLSDLRRGCVFKALIHDITLPRNGAERRIQLMNILDINTLLPIFSPALRRQLIECLPILMRSVHLNEIAHEYIIDLLNANIMAEEELAQLANNLRPLVTHFDETMRVRMVQILTEGILNEHLSPAFRNACAEELKGLWNDQSLLVAEALLQSAVRLYEYHADNFPMQLLYEAALSLVHCRNALIANMAIEFLRRFHSEQGEEGLLALVD